MLHPISMHLVTHYAVSTYPPLFQPKQLSTVCTRFYTSCRARTTNRPVCAKHCQPDKVLYTCQTSSAVIQLFTVLYVRW